MVGNRDIYTRIIREILTEYKEIIGRENRIHSVQELIILDLGDSRSPSSCRSVVETIFLKLPELSERFDLYETGQRLCTEDNLAELTKKDGINLVTERFVNYFVEGIERTWRVFVRAENLDLRKFTPLSNQQEQVSLRPLLEEEREGFRNTNLVSEERLDAFYFVVAVKAGDAGKAIEKGRGEIHQFLMPYYLHRVLIPDLWWRVRTERDILSSHSFCYLITTDPEQHEWIAQSKLKHVKTSAKELFRPKEPIDPDWYNDVAYLATVRDGTAGGVSELDECLSLCVHWMAKAEMDNDKENAYLKHSVAWEALFPEVEPQARRSWYLLALSAGAADPLCIKTVLQGEQLIDWRNSLAHPRLSPGTVWMTLEHNLYRLAQTLRRAFDSALRTRNMIALEKAKNFEWRELLDQTFNFLCRGQLGRPGDPLIALFLSTLCLTNESSHRRSEAWLNREGRLVRAEALALKGRKCAKSDPSQSVRHLARTYEIASKEGFCLTFLHVVRKLQDLQEDMDIGEFNAVWNDSGVTSEPPSYSQLKQFTEQIDREYGVSLEDTGWVERNGKS
jgi:hypothetical protein